MASFRQINETVVQMPRIGADLSSANAYKDLANIVIQASRLGEQVAETVTKDVASQNKQQMFVRETTAPVEGSAELFGESKTFQQIKDETKLLELERERRRISDRGVVSSLLLGDDKSLSSMLSMHPELLPETQDELALYVAKRFAKADLAQINSAIIKDATTDTNALFETTKQNRLNSIADAKTKYQYELALQSGQADLQDTALIVQSKRMAKEASIEAYNEFSTNIGKDVASGTFNSLFLQEHLDRLVATQRRVAPDSPELEVRDRAFNIMANIIGKNALNLDVAQLERQMNDTLYDSMGLADKYPQLIGIHDMVKGTLSELNKLRSTFFFDDVSASYEIVDNKNTAELIRQRWIKGVEEGTLSQLQGMKLLAKHNATVDRLKLNDEVDAVLGADLIDSKDNANMRIDDLGNTILPSVLLGPQHDPFINKKLERVAEVYASNNVEFGLDQRFDWQMRNIGRLIGTDLNLLKEKASSSNLADFAVAYQLVSRMYDANPAYVNSLTAGDKPNLDARLRSAINLAKKGGVSASVALQSLGSIDSTEYQFAENALNDSFRKDATDKSFADFMMNLLEASDIDTDAKPSSDLVQLTKDTAVLAYAQYAKNRGPGAEATRFAIESAKRYVKNNVVSVELDDDDYILPPGLAVFNYGENDWNNIGTLWRKRRTELERNIGVDSEDLRLDFGNKTNVERNGVAYWRIPVVDTTTYGLDIVDTGRDRMRNLYFEVPQDRLELKRSLDDTKPKTDDTKPKTKVAPVSERLGGSKPF